VDQVQRQGATGGYTRHRRVRATGGGKKGREREGGRMGKGGRRRGRGRFECVSDGLWVVVWEQVWRHWHGDCPSSQGLWHDRHRTTEV
jgi:hypothetical protein